MYRVNLCKRDIIIKFTTSKTETDDTLSHPLRGVCDRSFYPSGFCKHGSQSPRGHHPFGLELVRSASGHCPGARVLQPVERFSVGRRQRRRCWETTLTIQEGEHTYRFVVNGELEEFLGTEPCTTDPGLGLFTACWTSLEKSPFRWFAGWSATAAVQVASTRALQLRSLETNEDGTACLSEGDACDDEDPTTEGDVSRQIADVRANPLRDVWMLRRATTMPMR